MRSGLRQLLAGLLLSGSLCVNASTAAPVIDVLVLYSDSAASSLQGRDIDARIATYIEYANQAFFNSDARLRLRLVGSELLDEGLEDISGSSLESLRLSPRAAALRNQYGADLVVLLSRKALGPSGYLCGIAYVPGGDPDLGTLYGYAADAAFSLVGIDCGLSTFAHETGHNMGLGHAYLQNAEGGVWPWGRGHGVYGLFSTIMAYPQIFATANQLPRFSNPNQSNCLGHDCGISSEQLDGANAAESLNRLARQVAAFRSTQIPDGTGEPVTHPPHTPALCEKPELEQNLISNGDMNTLDGWSVYGARGQLQLVERIRNCGLDRLLVVTQRSRSYAGPYRDLSGLIDQNKTYRLSARLGLQGQPARANIRAAIRIIDEAGIRYQYLPVVSITNSELTPYSEDFRPDIRGALKSASLLFYGPPAGIDIIADEIKLVAAEIETQPPYQLIEDFETDEHGWRPYFDSLMQRAPPAIEGNAALHALQRRHWYSGVGRDVTGLIQSARPYWFQARIRFENANPETSLQLWAAIRSVEGTRWQYLLETRNSDEEWAHLTGEIVIQSTNHSSQVSLHLFGPPAGVDFAVDQIKVYPVNP